MQFSKSASPIVQLTRRAGISFYSSMGIGVSAAEARGPEAPKFASFVTDFDLTLTKVCSAPVLYQEVCQNFPERKEVCDQLSEEFSAKMRTLPTTEGFAPWCEELVNAELEMNKKIEDAKVFEGMNMNNVTFEMPLQDGVEQVMDHLSKQDVKRHVVSLCWHRPLIQKTVGPEWKVASNTLCNEDGKLNGDLDWDVPTGISKVEEMKSLPRPVVYVGDSISDIPALNYADIGFFLNPLKPALDAAQALDIQVKELKDDEVPQENGIYRITSWKQIAKWLGCET